MISQHTGLLLGCDDIATYRTFFWGASEADGDGVGVEVGLQGGDGNLAEMEDAGSEGSIGLTKGENIEEMLLLSCTSAGDDRDGEKAVKTSEGLVGKALLGAIMIHAGEEDLPCPTLLCLTGPLEELTLSTLTSTFDIAVPAIGIVTGVDGADTDLRAILRGYLLDELRTTEGSAVDTDLVGTGIQEA